VGLLTEYAATDWRADRTNDPRAGIQIKRGEWKQKSPAGGEARQYHKPGWLSFALRLDRKGQRDRSLDVLANRVDLLLSAKKFNEVDAMFEWVPTDAPSITFLMALLSLTLPATQRLPNRAAFYERVWQACVARNRNANELLGGLREWSRLDGTGPRAI
jgi:hypothetical protein